MPLLHLCSFFSHAELVGWKLQHTHSHTKKVNYGLQSILHILLPTHVPSSEIMLSIHSQLLLSVIPIWYIKIHIFLFGVQNELVKSNKMRSGQKETD